MTYVRLAASEDELTLFNNETVAAEHPHQAPSQLNKSVNREDEGYVSNTASPQLNESDISEASRSFPAGPASVLDGLKPQHLEDMICDHAGDAGKQLVTWSTALANLCLAGRIPFSVRSLFCALSRRKMAAFNLLLLAAHYDVWLRRLQFGECNIKLQIC